MKKLIALVMALAMLFPALSFADDQDPIVGCWYVLFDVDTLPEDMQKSLAESWQTYRTQLEFYVLRFTAAGEIFQVTGVFEDYGSDADSYGITGTWRKDDGGNYITTIVSGETGPAYLDGDTLSLIYYRGGARMKFRRMITFDIMNDLARK